MYAAASVMPTVMFLGMRKMGAVFAFDRTVVPIFNPDRIIHRRLTSDIPIRRYGQLPDQRSLLINYLSHGAAH